MRALWLLFAALLGGGLTMFAFGSPASVIEMWKDPCRGFCGQSLGCVQGQCQPVPEQVAPPPSKADQKKPKKKARARRKVSGNIKLAWANDRGIPRFDPNAIQKIGAGDASGRLDQLDIDRVLKALEPAWHRCIERADTRAQGTLSTGRVHLSFGVNGAGKVTGVNARAPKALAKFGIVPCVRLAIYKTKFPAYNGPETRVESHFDVEF